MKPDPLALREAALHEDVAEQFSGTGEPYFDTLVEGHRRSAALAYRQADQMVFHSLKTPQEPA